MKFESKDEYVNHIQTKLKESDIIKLMNMPKREVAFFRHAYYHINCLVDEQLVIEDMDQVFHAIMQIEQEATPNVPVVSLDMKSAHTQSLREMAIVFMAKGLIKGLTEEEVQVLKRILALILTSPELELATETVEKLREADPKVIEFPVPYPRAKQYLDYNRMRLEA